MQELEKLVKWFNANTYCDITYHSVLTSFLNEIETFVYSKSRSLRFDEFLQYEQNTIVTYMLSGTITGGNRSIPLSGSIRTTKLH